jgi:glycosyltransferase involved in cell wall biosynthesis
VSPFFSVVIPVFNRARELAAALRSVLDQSERDFEIVVVDDGSIDDPNRIVAEIADPRIVFLRQENRGGGAARNAGIERARGRFIAFLDSDDRFLPGHLARMRTELVGTQETAGYARILVDRGRGRTFLKPPRAILAGEHMATYLLCDRGFVPTITLVVPSEIARRVRYDESLPFAQDTDFAIRLFLAGCRFTMVEDAGAIWQDTSDPRRISSGRKGAKMAEWLERLRPLIPSKAYYGGRGWMIAKGVALTDRLAALRFYIGAVTRGCYRPRIMAVVALQIFFPDWVYRRLADGLIAWSRGAVWSRAERLARPRGAALSGDP